MAAALKLPFRELPGDRLELPRPVVDIGIGGLTVASFASLIDTGSTANRYGTWIAEAAGIDLGAATAHAVGLGGTRLEAYEVPVDLRLGPFGWRAAVAFCDPWPHGFGLLGQEGFLRFFHLVLSAADFTMELTPVEGVAVGPEG